MRVSVGDVELYVREEGAGRPLVLLHGGPGLDSVEELTRIGERLAAFQPEYLRGQVTRSWAAEATVQTAEEAERLWRDQLPFHAADPEGDVVRQMQASAGDIVFRPDVLRHFASGGEYGMVDNRERLRQRRLHVLVLSGAEDRTTPAAAAHRLAEMLAGAEEVVIPGAAHMLLQEQPEATLAALRAFLARVPA